MIGTDSLTEAAWRELEGIPVIEAPKAPEKTDPVLQALEGTRARIIQGWTQGTRGNRNGEVCLLGGLEMEVYGYIEHINTPGFELKKNPSIAEGVVEILRMVGRITRLYRSPVYRKALKEIRKATGRVLPTSVIDFNDHNRRTQEEVVAVLDRAIANYKRSM